MTEYSAEPNAQRKEAMVFRKPRIAWIVALLVVALLGVGTGFVMAATATSVGEGGIFYAAYSLKNGSMRIMQNATDYNPKNEGFISWHQQGPQGPAGPQGISIIWLGTFANAPDNPSTNNAYYNSTDKKSYIYNGTTWSILAQDGAQGPAGIIPASEPWHEIGASGQPSFGSYLTYSWHNALNANTAAFYKDPFGVIHLKGLVWFDNDTYVSSTPVFILPDGYRPPAIATYSNAAASAGVVTIHPDGRIMAVFHNVSLDGITFRAED